MANRISVGIGIGALVAALSWRGNIESHLVSTFPDGVTILALISLLFVAIRSDLRRRGQQVQGGSYRAGLAIATAAGVVFGAGNVALGFVRFSQPFFGLLMFSFVTALGLSVAVGTVITAWLSSRQGHQAV